LDFLGRGLILKICAVCTQPRRIELLLLPPYYPRHASDPNFTSLPDSQCELQRDFCLRLRLELEPACEETHFDHSSPKAVSSPAATLHRIASHCIACDPLVQLDLPTAATSKSTACTPHSTSAAKSSRRRRQPTGTTHRIKRYLHPIRAASSFFAQYIPYHSLNRYDVFASHSVIHSLLFPLPTHRASPPTLALSRSRGTIHRPPLHHVLYSTTTSLSLFHSFISPFHSPRADQQTSLLTFQFRRGAALFRKLDGN
jgi:hypothetical protein